jgi:hypothetical protein
LTSPLLPDLERLEVGVEDVRKSQPSGRSLGGVAHGAAGEDDRILGESSTAPEGLVPDSTSRLEGPGRQGLALSLAATGAGLAAGWVAASALEGLVFGVSVRDLAVFSVVPVLLAGVTAVAVFVPARRACAVEPSAALEHD